MFLNISTQTMKLF